ncbi:MAG: helix-turn-helix domain-containing protein [Candidatus Brocadiae bacterium]|nr:helix-turn-helix domain-containing protein [Candidatus Brocadiia bacterium]
MLINIEKLVPHPANDQILPSLTKEEKKNLEESLTKQIKPVPLDVLERKDGMYLVLDGNNRLSLLNQNGHKGDLECFILGKEEDWSFEKQEEYMLNTNLTRRNLSKKQKMDIAKMQTAKGRTQDEVSKILGISQQTVSNYTKDIKETRQDVLKESIARLRGAGLTQEKTGEVVGLAQQSVANIEKELNIPQNVENREIEPIILEVKNKLSPNEVLCLASSKPRVKKIKSNTLSEDYKKLKEENRLLNEELQYLKKEKKEMSLKIEEQANSIKEWELKASSVISYSENTLTDEHLGLSEKDEQSNDNEDEQPEDERLDMPDEDEQLGTSDEEKQLLSEWTFNFVPKLGKQCAKNAITQEKIEFNTKSKENARAELLKKLKERR